MKHCNQTLHYVDLHPQSIEPDEPSPFAVIGGAFVAAAALYLLTVLCFSL